MSRINLTTILVAVAIIILAFGAGFLGLQTWGGWGMMGAGMMSGMFLMWVIPGAVLILAVLGVIWLAQTMGRHDTPASEISRCPSCGRRTQQDWRHCAYCGTNLPA